jgi:hypothetical protein
MSRRVVTMKGALPRASMRGGAGLVTSYAVPKPPPGVASASPMRPTARPATTPAAAVQPLL